MMEESCHLVSQTEREELSVNIKRSEMKHVTDVLRHFNANV